MKAGAMLNRYWAIIRRPTSRASRILSPVTVTMGFYVHIYVCVYIYYCHLANGMNHQVVLLFSSTPTGMLAPTAKRVSWLMWFTHSNKQK